MRCASPVRWPRSTKRRTFTLLLMADAVSAAEGGQKMPEGFLQRRAHVEAGARQDPCPAMRHLQRAPGRERQRHHRGACRGTMNELVATL